MDSPNDKMIRKEDSKTKEPALPEVAELNEYFYPDQGITIRAVSQEDADIALANKLGGATL